MSGTVTLERKNSPTKPISLDNAVKTDSTSQFSEPEFNGIARNAMAKAAGASGIEQKWLAFNQHLNDLGGERLLKKSFILVAHSDAADNEKCQFEKQGSKASFVETGQDGFRYIAVIY